LEILVDKFQARTMVSVVATPFSSIPIKFPSISILSELLIGTFLHHQRTLSS